MNGYTRKEFLCSACKRALGLLPAAAILTKHGKAQIPGQFSRLEVKGEIQATASGGAAFEPSYLTLQASGELKRRGQELWNSMRHCEICPRECHENRLRGEKGECGSTDRVKVASYGPGFDEETPRELVGSGGTGSIVMSNCSLRCAFCLDWQASHGGSGKPEDIEGLAAIMLEMQDQGCNNINIVTPTHYSPHILLALDLAASSGLRLPLVYSTSGWEKGRILRRLEGIVDIYLSDFKYFNPATAAKYSDSQDSYPEVTKRAILEMQRQVGTARASADGTIHRGLMIRHLVMPGNIGETRGIISWIAENLPKDTYLYLMPYYRPVYKASKFPEIDRRLNIREYREVVNFAEDAGLTNLITGEV